MNMCCKNMIIRFDIRDIVDIVVNYQKVDMEPLKRKYGLTDECMVELRHRILSGKAEIGKVGVSRKDLEVPLNTDGRKV